MPPWNERTKEQKRLSTRAVKDKNKKHKKKGTSPSQASQAGTPTEMVSQATEIRLTHRFYNMDYSPTLRMAQDAAVKYFRWRPDMPLGNFIDTVLYLYFKEKGITLCGYIVDDEIVEAKKQQEVAA